MTATLLYLMDGDFMRFRGSDADIVAAILGVTRDRRGCGIPKHRIDDWTATLRGHGYMLAVDPCIPVAGPLPLEAESDLEQGRR